MNINRQINGWQAARVSPADVRHTLERFFLQSGSTGEVGAEGGQWVPRVDIREDDKQFVILADIPGVDPSKIEVSMDKGVLSIKGERAVDAAEAPARFTRVERVSGGFHRQFSLPDSADAEGIVANGKWGVLEILIPKKALATPRRITINASH